ncbi:GNAT family N-acetyltransferase [Acrocarpospora catenulata]|uniref:GNAT family N-acetyltransferase n=1 Tax=Acrocarpospora catenulata TaxID=2836182 RepID=UPI001BDA1293|nr:GNAT family N-acetyltransferase [Acrocarpospora catenulata]
MGEAVEVRPGRDADVGAVATIWREGWRDGHLTHVPDALVAVRTAESFAVRAGDRVADTTVAVVGGAVAGFVMVAGDEVEQVYCDRRHRGGDVANTLIAEAERLVAAARHERAWLAVVAGNGRARRFYERNGWIDEGPFDYPARTDDGPISVPCHRYTKRVANR